MTENKEQPKIYEIDIDIVQFWQKNVSPWQKDTLIFIALLLANPIIWGYRFPFKLFPDSALYLTLARDMLSTGSLYLESWGHIDTNIVAPPLFPGILALSKLIFSNSILAGKWINAAFMILAAVPIYFLVKNFSDRFFAAMAVVLFQLNLGNIYFASYILTEPIFLFLLLTSLLLAAHILLKDKNRVLNATYLGLLVAMLFLVRQAGITLLAFIVLYFSILALRSKSDARRKLFRVVAAVTGTWILIISIYATVLYQQTGVSPFHQKFRANNYAVTVTDQKILAQIKEISSVTDTNYDDIYRKRRDLRRLLPDGTEMYSHVLDSSGKQAADPPKSEANLLWRSIRQLFSPDNLLQNFFSNLSHLRIFLGWALFILVAVSFFTPLVFKNRTSESRARLLIPGFVVTYVFAISILTSAVDRYIAVLYPLVLVQLVIEIAIVFRIFVARIKSSSIHTGIMLALFSIIFLLMPLKFYKTGTNPRSTISIESWSAFRKHISEGEPIFSIAPAYTYLAGGKFRILPNDSLDKLVMYAHLTGVKWLLVPKRPQLLRETSHYSSSKWLLEPQELRNHPSVIQLRHEQEDARVASGIEHALYEIMP